MIHLKWNILSYLAARQILFFLIKEQHHLLLTGDKYLADSTSNSLNLEKQQTKFQHIGWVKIPH